MTIALVVAVVSCRIKKKLKKSPSTLRRGKFFEYHKKFTKLEGIFLKKLLQSVYPALDTKRCVNLYFFFLALRLLFVGIITHTHTYTSEMLGLLFSSDLVHRNCFSTSILLYLEVPNNNKITTEFLLKRNKYCINNDCCQYCIYICMYILICTTHARTHWK